MTRADLKGKIKTLTQGQVSDGVVDKMAMTFLALAQLADFDAPGPRELESNQSETTDTSTERSTEGDTETRNPARPADQVASASGIRLGGFVYNVELHLPESRDPAVYEALFRALKSHLLS